MRIKEKQNLYIPKILVCTIAVYCCLAILYYWLMGDQLHLRRSRGDIEMKSPEAGTIELVQGTVVEQVFEAEIQRLHAISVQWGTYYRTNTGTVTMELYNTLDGSLVAANTFNATNITEGGVTTVSIEPPIENLYNIPLLLRIWSNSSPGSAVSPLMAFTDDTEEGFELSINGVRMDGVLCFSASGEDYIWTGLHYWKFVTGFGILLIISELCILFRWKKGKHSYVVNALIALKKYRFLIQQLVSRDFKTKYKRSVLGVIWSFLNPLLTMAVQYAVFSNLFRFDIPYYPVYLIIGIVIFSFFSEATNMALGSIVGNAGLITKVYMPKYIYPLTRVLSSLVNLTISLIPLMFVVLISGIVPTKAYFLVAFALLCLAVFSLGVGLLLAAAMVFFRDIQFLWGVITMIWSYITPIFYPASILPDEIAWVLNVNPLYYIISFARMCVINGISPEPIAYAQCAFIALGSLLIGTLVFRKSQDLFVLYL